MDPPRVKARRYRCPASGTKTSTACFGVLKRGGKVYSKMIPDARAQTSMPIVNRVIPPDSIVYTDTWASHNVFDISGFHHVRINRSKPFANRDNHIKSIENFWNQAKRHRRKFNAVPKQHFNLFLKECEWRFNGGSSSQVSTQIGKWIKIANHK